MSNCLRRQAKALLVGVATLSLGACAGLGEGGPDFFTKASTPLQGDKSMTQASAPVEGSDSAGELQKATDYWGKEYAQKPQSLEAALAFAKNLKAMGQKGQAIAVLQQASVYHGADKKLASEYGRLALELDQVTIAQQLLALADDPALPDWRVVSARGTALAKQGKYQDAIPFYERALTLAPDKASVMNNLALALTMNGEAAKAEDMLRRAQSLGPVDNKVHQNLALVLGLQGKYDEATKVASADMSADKAASNTAMVRQMVKLEPKVMPQGVIAMPPPVQVAGPALPATATKATAAATLKPGVTDTTASGAASAWTANVASAPATPAVWSAATVAKSTQLAQSAPAAAPVTGAAGLRPSSN